MIRKAIKESGKLIKGHRLEVLGLYVLYVFLILSTTFTSTVYGSTFTASSVCTPVLVVLLILPFAYGMYYYCINLKEGKAKLEDVIEFYIDYKTGLKLILASLWYMLIVCIGFVLLIVPGIIWSYRYVLAFYLLIDNRDMTITDAFKKSKELMHGHKFKYFIASIALMIIPMLLYVVGITGLAATTYSNVITMKINEQALDQEDVESYNMPFEAYEEITDEDATIDELEEITDINNEIAPEVSVIPAIIFGLLFIIGVVLILYVTPRVLCVEVAYYQALIEK